MKYRVGILTILILIANFAEASPYYRFWRGWKKSELSSSELQKALNEKFILATVKTGQGHGLLAYMPSLLPVPEQRPKAFAQEIPDEIALVVYKSKQAFDDLYATPNGKDYAASHWFYFDKDRGSHSTVPESFSTELKTDHAYDVLQSDADWQAGTVVFAVSEMTKDSVAHVQSLQKKSHEIGLESYIVLVTDHLLIEYQLWSHESQTNLPKSLLVEQARKTLPSSPQIQFGETINTQFKP